jgi:single-strand DNA-binding protein
VDQGGPPEVEPLAAAGTKMNNMNKLRNRVQLIGHLGMNPEIKVLESGTKLAKFSLATNDSFTNSNGERVDETEWHNVIAWNKTADLVESYLEKGKEVALEGKLSTRSWEDENGNKKYMTEIVCHEILFLGSRD